MHYSQGRDRWFGRIQSAPTVDENITVNVNGDVRNSSSQEGMKLLLTNGICARMIYNNVYSLKLHFRFPQKFSF